MKNVFTCLCLLMAFLNLNSCRKTGPVTGSVHTFNGEYSGEFLNRVAFPMGGIGAGMICLEGTGCLSHVSVRNSPDLNHEPYSFSAISVEGFENATKLLEGPVSGWKVFGKKEAGNGLGETTYGLPRFEQASFLARFPFGIIQLRDHEIPLKASIQGWSPFIPCDEDNSSLPVAALEYTFTNTSGQTINAVYSFNSTNFMRVRVPSEGGRWAEGDRIESLSNGFILVQEGTDEYPHLQGTFAAFVTDEEAVIDHCWFRGGWWDPATITWKTIAERNLRATPPQEGSSPGASIFVPFALEPGGSKTIKLLLAWYVPCSNLQRGNPPDNMPGEGEVSCCQSSTYSPWYTAKFETVEKVYEYWKTNYDNLKNSSQLFSDAFYGSTLPPEVLEAVAANLTILKSPTVLRQTDGRLWCWEGCHESLGCCHGSCTHVWNYAQAIPHLFPKLERTLRYTEFHESQSSEGHQTFRANIPISPAAHDFYAAADGQLGGIMKVYREWRISGREEWLKEFWPMVKQSMNYCIETWDPKHNGVVEEPHHNTYDIEFWGPDGMCMGFYLGALYAATQMGDELDEDITLYQELYEKGRKYMENELFNDEYFVQMIKTEGLVSPSPVEIASQSFNLTYSPEALEMLKKEGPKYQYGNGCISDGVLGIWLAEACGLQNIINQQKVKSHLLSIYRYNLQHDLSDHVNPQRPSFAMGKDGGLLLCTWPKGDAPSLPFVYSNEVWTGIEYQVASHLMMNGFVDEGLDIIRTCRKRYDGRIRNPFDEYECGHWYARAMSSYGLLQGLTGIRYDAVDNTLYIDSRIGNSFKSFLSTETGFGQVGLENGKPFIDVKMGEIPVKKIIVSGEEYDQ